MRIYIRASAEGFPETDSGYCAYQGFRALGFQPVLYRGIDELTDCRPDDLIVGGVSVVRDRLASYGITVREYDYPEELSGFLGRRIWTDTFSSVLSNGSGNRRADRRIEGLSGKCGKLHDQCKHPL